MLTDTKVYHVKELQINLVGRACSSLKFSLLAYLDVLLGCIVLFSLLHVVMKRTLAYFSVLTNKTQGPKGTRSALPVNDGLESDTWYQVSAVSERTQGVFGEPVYAVVKTHRDPARVVDASVLAVPGSTDSLAVMARLDCSSAPTNEACGIMRYRGYLEIEVPRAKT